MHLRLHVRGTLPPLPMHRDRAQQLKRYERASLMNQPKRFEQNFRVKRGWEICSRPGFQRVHNCGPILSIRYYNDRHARHDIPKTLEDRLYLRIATGVLTRVYDCKVGVDFKVGIISKILHGTDLDLQPTPFEEAC